MEMLEQLSKDEALIYLPCPVKFQRVSLRGLPKALDLVVKGSEVIMEDNTGMLEIGPADTFGMKGITTTIPMKTLGKSSRSEWV